jgi:hypothetical protein
MKILDNWLTILLVILAIITTIVLLNKLPVDESTYINKISLVGTVASFYGLIIAYVQILKVASNTKTYEDAFNKTLYRLKNNDTISVISRAIQQISLIKKFYDLEKIENTRDNFNNLMIDLSILSKSDKLGKDSEKFDKFIEFCTIMETNIITNNISTDPSILRENFLTLSQIQRYLIGISENFKTPDKNE